MGGFLVHVVIAHGIQNDVHLGPFAVAVRRIDRRYVFVELASVGGHQNYARVFPGYFQPLVNVGGIEQDPAADILQFGSKPFAVAVGVPALQFDKTAAGFGKVVPFAFVIEFVYERLGFRRINAVQDLDPGQLFAFAFRLHEFVGELQRLRIVFDYDVILDDRAGYFLAVRRQNFHNADRAFVAHGVVVNGVALKPAFAALHDPAGAFFVFEESRQLLRRCLRFRKIAQGPVIDHKLKVRIRSVGSALDRLFQIRFPLKRVGGQVKGDREIKVRVLRFLLQPFQYGRHLEAGAPDIFGVVASVNETGD